MDLWLILVHLPIYWDYLLSISKKVRKIITPNLTFSTTIAPIYQLGLIPHFIGVEKNKFLADPAQIEKCINKKTVALMIPNLLGNIADWKKIFKIAKNII